MGKIIVAGSINMDVVAQTEHLPRAGETIFGRDLHYIPGGKGSNQAVAAGRLSDNVYLAAKLGHDAFGDSLKNFLEQESLHLDYLQFSETAPTGVALIVVDDRSENHIVVISGSNYELNEADVSAIDITPADILVSVFEIPQETILALFKRAKAKGAKTILNPAPAKQFMDGLQELVDYLIVNETELAFFAGTTVSEEFDTLKHQAKQLRSHDEQVIIVTLGAKGLIALRGNELIHIEGQAVKAIDTTGAGDCFVGAFSVALSAGQALEKALHFANLAASLSVQKLGASSSMPYRADMGKAGKR